MSARDMRRAAASMVQSGVQAADGTQPLSAERMKRVTKAIDYAASLMETLVDARIQEVMAERAARLDA